MFLPTFRCVRVPLPWPSLIFLKQCIEIVPAKQMVVIHRMPVGQDLSCRFPLRRVFGDTPKFLAASEMRWKFFGFYIIRSPRCLPMIGQPYQESV